MDNGQSEVRTEGRDGASIADCRLPTFYPGMRVGLFGGTFDPPHAGHLEVSRVALRALALDQVWWLVSPHNPLKPHAPADLARRIAAARALTRDPRIRVTGVEAALGTTYTAETLMALPGRGIKKIAILAPAFSVDCIETLEELAITGREQFMSRGGEKYAYIPCLNDSEPGMAVRETLVRRVLAGWI